MCLAIFRNVIRVLIDLHIHRHSFRLASLRFLFLASWKTEQSSCVCLGEVEDTVGGEMESGLKREEMDGKREGHTEAASSLKLNLETLKLKQVFFPSGSKISSLKAFRFADSSESGTICLFLSVDT